MSAAAAYLAPGALAFGRLRPQSSYAAPGFSHPHEGKVAEASARCRESLGHGLGPRWMQCVVDTLLVQQAAALSENRHDYFPVVNHSYTPFAAQHEFHNEPGYVQHDLLKNLLRNATCDIDDGGSQPVRSFVWEHRPTDPCGGTPTDDSHGDSVFQHKAGFLPAGNDLTELDGILSEEAAKERCAADSRCQGFTFSKSGPAVGAKHNMIFKSFGDDVSMSPDWQTWRRRDEATQAAASHIEGRSRSHLGPPPRTPTAAASHAYDRALSHAPSHTCGAVRRRGAGNPLDCSLLARRARLVPRRLKVDVLREAPPVYVVHDFLSTEECGFMMNKTVPHMGPSVVGGGGTSQWRKSYSVNMQPDFDDESHIFTQVARRKFAFAREAAGYAHLQEGDGQEPVNAVYYKDNGDQYRPHCDGECGGGRYYLGSRLATGLSYCQVADQGGYTLFTRTGLKVVPKPRQMLFFGYMFNGANQGEAMDNGWTEHTGCPLRRGKKWIATMWYREGVTAEKNWEYYSRRGSQGV